MRVDGETLHAAAARRTNLERRKTPENPEFLASLVARRIARRKVSRRRHLHVCYLHMQKSRLPPGAPALVSEANEIAAAAPVRDVSTENQDCVAT
jgi:hypothetical protein